ncbi:MAG: peptidoglycan DD-metalloendopeptidase family protein [Okeania sp. SIO3B5]|uniref:peptidoglycan DD-metalloendopeptidase family protein n=1 Tax=Okeania sp. SIO3B5 TaxID=2607811 RepID=UPI0013FF2D9F|nr:peptidoglycan DD-metalloendopeptidase family protein [Okeania sp. SIO3B5]NEO57764.1 peptidoglycan DD-metalloendopeptidase family protein [Okeania sp. SIO3B5]
MKRTFPSKGKSAATCELSTEATIEQSKQINTVGSKTSSAAAMIGLAAISTTMGAPGILLSGKGDLAAAAELPGVDTNKHELSTRELNTTGVNSPKGLLLQKLTKGYVETEGNTDSEVEATQPETVLPSENTLGEQSFFPIELQQKHSQTKARASEQETLVFSERKIDKLETNELPPLGPLGKVQAKKTIGNNSQLIDQLTVETNSIQTKPENLSTKNSVESRYEQYISEPVGKSFDKSKEKFLENRDGKSENLVVEEPALQIATSSELDNSSTAKQVTDSQIDIGQESIKTEGTKLEGAVVIDSDMTSTPVSLVYKVRAGDTLSLIAKENNVSVDALAKANNIKNLDVIEAAKLLKIPQQQFSESSTLVSSTSSNSTKEELSQPSLETTTNQLNIPEVKVPNIKSNYLSDSVPNVTGAEVAPQRSVQLVSWSEGVDDGEHQIHKKPKEFSTSTQLVATDSPKNPLVNKVWPDNLGTRESRQNPVASSSSSQPVQPLPVDINTESGELLPKAISDRQNNPYANRLRSEISRLRQEYNNQKELEDSQTITSEAINIPVPEPWSSEQNLLNNSQIINENNSSRYLQPTYQEEVNSSQTRQWSEEMEARRPEIRNPATVVKELPLERNISQYQGPSVMAAAPIGANFNEILNNPSLGKMVSPDLPPLGKADTYLPGGSMQFTGYTWPSKGTLTSGYGWRWGRMHRGIDIAAPTGTPIVAAAPGVVTFANWNSGGYGNLVEIKHPNGSLTIYAHNSQILVREGQKVAQGELIAKMGSTGRSTGPHLHFEIHPTGNGAVNPMALLRSGATYN